MSNTIRKLGNTFAKTFKEYPRATYNLLFWGLVSLTVLIIYLTNTSSLEKTVFVKKAIAELKLKQQLDTLNRLLNGNEVTIRDFPFLKTYTLIPNRRNLTDGSPVKTKNFFSGRRLAFLPTSENSYMSKDQKTNSWRMDTLEGGLRLDRFIFDVWEFSSPSADYVDYSSNSDLDLVVPLINPYSSQQSFLKIGATQLIYRLPDSLSSSRLIDFHSTGNEVLFSTEHNGKAGKDTIELIKISFDGQGSFRKKASLYLKPNRSFTMNNSGWSSGAILTGKGDSNWLTQLDPFRFRPGKEIWLPSIRCRLAEGSSFSAAPFYSYLFSSDNSYTLFIDSIARLKLYRIDENGAKLIGGKSIGKGSVIEGGYYFSQNTIRYVYSDNDSIAVIRADIGDTSVRFSVVRVPGDNLKECTLSSDLENTYLLGHDTKGNRHLFTIYRNGHWTELEQDRDFLKSARNADLYISRYGKSPEFILRYPNGIATVSVQKIDGNFDSRLIGEINWPQDAFEVEVSIDAFYIILLVAFIITIYFSLYFSLRSYFSRGTIVIDYDAADSVFKKIPTLTGKIKMVENVVKVLMLRSDTMLGLGIIFGVGGVLASIIVFQITENNVTTWNDPHTVLGILRPVILLVFIETFTFFFLKQYRIIFNEYKLFYSVYLRLLNYYHIIECDTNLSGSSELAEKIGGRLLKEKFDLYETNTKTPINEFDDSFIIKLLEKYADAFKQGTG